MTDSNEPIYVTKTFLPPKEEFDKYVDRIWQTYQLTNNGPLSREFEDSTSRYLGLDGENFRFVANGTLALQLALRALDITEGEVITTPFSYVATTSAILWERCDPVYVDIDPETLNIDPRKIETAITSKTKAIMPVHLFGNPCDIEAIEAIANKHNLKVIYDGAHAFGAIYKERSLLSYGDISTCSFHATKIFHTIEGGCVISNDTVINEKVELIKRFGHNLDDHRMLGINAKASEFQAAMGLCNLEYIEDIIKQRKYISGTYDSLLGKQFSRPALGKNIKYNYSYYPVLAESEKKLLDIIERLNEQNIFPRRYFFPSLNTLPYLKNVQSCPISEDISKRIICLPLYSELEEESIIKICRIINK